MSKPTRTEPEQSRASSSPADGLPALGTFTPSSPVANKTL
jgi:hypothetical protein